jgi:hypothetical protein
MSERRLSIGISAFLPSGLRLTIGWIARSANDDACFHAALHNITTNSSALSANEDIGAMRQSDRRDPARDTAGHVGSRAVWLPVLVAMAIMAAGCISTFLVLQLDEFRPGVGDIVTFTPGSEDPDLWQTVVPATLVSAMGIPVAVCSLDPNVIAEKGGSLVVEGLQNKPSLQYRLHWAGTGTARAGGDCGPSADLLVSRTDLQRLANAAGGFGVGDKGVVR